MQGLWVCLSPLFAITFGWKLNHVFKLYLPGYAQATPPAQIAQGAPVLLGILLVCRGVSLQLLAWTGDAQGSALLTMIAAVSVLLWLCDRRSEHN